MNIFVGNLSAAVTADDLRRLFDGYGTTINVIIMRDTDTGLPLGYGLFRHHVHMAGTGRLRGPHQPRQDQPERQSHYLARMCLSRRPGTTSAPLPVERQRATCGGFAPSQRLRSNVRGIFPATTQLTIRSIVQ